MSNSVIPLESNPELFSQFSQFLGLSPNLQYVDVYSLTDDDLLSFIPRPASSLILLFPITEEYEKLRKTEDQETKEENHKDEVIWFKQTVKNACGLFALLNSISNLPDEYFTPGSKILEFKSAAGNVEKVEQLISEFQGEYQNFAQSGQTEAPDAEADVNLHFLSIIKKEGKVYELDGRRQGPVLLSKGDDNGDVLSEQAVKDRFLQYVDLADEENKLNFSVIALAPTLD